MNRRRFLASSALGLSALSAANQTAACATPRQTTGAVSARFPVSIFSKHLQWLDYGPMAETAAELGFEGVDLTVRPGGHVLPERVADDLPRAVEAVRKAGLEVHSIVTAIEGVDDEQARNVLRVARALGVLHYRLGWFHYDDKKPIGENLIAIEEKMRRIDSMNSELGVVGSYQNHSGAYFGAAVWDLGNILSRISARSTGSQYDIYHATIEGANSWIYGLEYIAPYIRTINVKDFEWVRKDGRWSAESVPLGHGAVDFDRYFSLLKQFSISAPLSVHYEYSLGGADQGTRTTTMPKKEILAAMRRDLAFLQEKMKKHDLAG